ncbi:MAG TPA: hypothetical protein VMF32_21030, partial [Xanthobacteraceae bacterium]|nr:hypothetical protein [Xanthobacteraceae bacterium]
MNQWLQLVAFPLVTVIISICGAYHVWLQFQLQGLKLKADLYQRVCDPFCRVEMPVLRSGSIPTMRGGRKDNIALSDASRNLSIRTRPK